MTLKLISISNFLVLLLLAAVPAAYADAGDEATITVVDEGDTPEDVVRVIELPQKVTATAAKPASENSNAKDNNAKDNKENKEQASTETTDKAGESATDSGTQAVQEAKDAKELNKDLKEQAKEEAKQQGKKGAHDDNGGGKGHGPH
jgi:hypothetical protein